MDQKARQIKYLDHNQVERLLRVIHTPRDRAMFEIGFHRGLRVSELGMLRMEDYRRDSGRLYVTRAKGSISGEYPLLKRERAALNAWLKVRGDAPGCIFPSRLGSPISQQRVDVMTKRFFRLAGLPSDRAHFHTLRHSCAVWLLEQDRDLLEIQDHLGHASITNTAIYARVSPVRRERMAKDIEAGVTKRR